jgi:hypothetical protein
VGQLVQLDAQVGEGDGCVALALDVPRLAAGGGKRKDVGL